MKLFLATLGDLFSVFLYSFATVGLQQFLLLPDSSSAVKMRPTRNVKRNRRIFNSSTQSESPRKQSRPAPLKVDVPLTAKEVAQNNGLRLRNLLKLPKAHKWVRYEWFYSSLD